MRQLATTEVTAVSGGSEALFVASVIGLTALTLGLIASTPVRPRVCDQVITPVFDPYTGAYLGDMVDSYCY